MKLKPFRDGDKFGGYAFYCPGCEHAHHFYVPRWTFDGDLERPTFSPSLRVFHPEHDDEDGKKVPERTLCHLFLKNGELQYCSDSPHKLAGKHVPLPDWPYSSAPG